MGDFGEPVFLALFRINGCGVFVIATGTIGLDVRFVGLFTFDRTTCGCAFDTFGFLTVGFDELIIGLTVILLLTGGKATRFGVTVIALLFVNCVTALRFAASDDVEASV